MNWDTKEARQQKGLRCWMESNKDVKLSDLGGYYPAPAHCWAVATTTATQNNINGQQQQWVGAEP